MYYEIVPMDRSHIEQIARLELLPARDLLAREAELLVEAKRLLPRFLVDDIDVLVVDEIGKDISGAGMDPNITGRAPEDAEGFGTASIRRIVVLGLTDRTHGNACGLGMADVTTQRCLDQVEFGSFCTNALTSGVLESARIPWRWPTTGRRSSPRCTPPRGPGDPLGEPHHWIFDADGALPRLDPR